MLQQLIDDMNNALSANCYLSALSIALMLPDICGKAEYPNKGVGERYKDWYNRYVGQFEIPPTPKDYSDKVKLPYLSGEVVYSLRNSFLHQGTPNIEPEKIQESVNKIDFFSLVKESKNDFDIYVDASGICNDNIRTYRVNIRGLCNTIGLTASAYYKNNIVKFNFFNYTLIDWDNELEKMNRFEV